MLFSPTVLAAVALCIGLYTLAKIPKLLEHYRFSRKHKCKSAGPYRDFLGFRRLYELWKAVLTNELPAYGETLFSRHKRTTVPVQDMGYHGFMTNEPKNVQYMLTHLGDWGLGVARESFHYFLGRGIFTQDGAAWAQSRALIRPSFTRAQIADFVVLEEHMQELFVAIDELSDEHGILDLQPLIYDLTMDFASEYLFGETAHAISHRRQGGGNLGVAHWFDRGMYHITLSSTLGAWHWLWRPRDYTKAAESVHEYADKFIAQALAARREKAAEGEEGESEKERVKRGGGRYVFLNALTGSIQHPMALRAQILNILLAGRDTTAALISWAMWTLAREQEVLKRLRAEIDATFGTGANARVPTWQGLKDMRYLQAVIHETLRCYPSVPYSNRTAMRNTILPVGGGVDGTSPVFVPKGNLVTYSIYSMHRRKDMWGDDADKFLPERWLRADAGKRLREIGWGHLPFSGGPRICPGQPLALTEASYVVTRILQRFCAVMKKGGVSDAPTFSSSAVTPPGDGVWIRLEKY